MPRSFNVGNSSQLSGWPYALETGLLEMLLQSEHRTLDPEEAGGQLSADSWEHQARQCQARMHSVSCWASPLAQIHFTKLANAFIAAADFFYVPVFPSCFIESVR